MGGGGLQQYLTSVGTHGKHGAADHQSDPYGRKRVGCKVVTEKRNR